MREFMAKLFGSSAANELAKLPAVSVMLFGKHRAWGDHIDNLGDESQLLLFARDLLYSEGLNRQIGTGAWEKLAPDRRLPSFDHFFVWYVGGRMLTGLLWSSSDSRGRTQYPLVLVAETHRRHDPALIRQIQQALLLAKQRCVEATEQNTVTRTVAELRGALQQFCPRQPVESNALQLAVDFSPPADAVPRVLHELRGSCGHLSGSRWSPGESPEGASAIRVPLSAANFLDLLDWLALVASQIHPAVSLLGFAERSEGIGDLLLGTPSAQNFFCLRATPKTLPFTTDIPFEIATGLREYANSLVGGLKQGQRPARTVFGDLTLPQSPWLAPISLLKS
jgi:hypothetical protein